ncbi:MAG: UvrD-helicase domain-containing protein, partial [Parachlamydiaceae bacterium]
MSALASKLIIEASAGCGKTYRIEQLVLDLLEEGIELKEMVIVTFTKVQAEDLKTKIYKRLKNAPSKKAKRALKLFDEANISTLHSMAQKILHEKGPNIDFHNDKVATFSLFKSAFAATLRHDIPHDVIAQEQIKRFIAHRGDLLRDVHQNLARKKSYLKAGDLVEKLMRIRAAHPLSYDDAVNELSKAIPHLLKKYEENGFDFIELFKSSSWGEIEFIKLLKSPPYTFPEEGWRKNTPLEARLSHSFLTIVRELKALYDESKESAWEA